MLPKLWRQWRKYSIGLTTHAVFNPLVPLSWQRIASDSIGHLPFLLPAGVHESLLQLGGRPVRRFVSDDSRQDAAMVFFHGGGFTAGSLHSHRPMCAHLARACRVPVYSVDYRLAPEHPYPAAPDDCEAATLALLERPGIRPERLLLAGDSAGGNLALSTALRLRAQGLRPAALLLLSPWCDPADTNLPWRFDPVINPWWGMASARAYRGKHPDAHEPGLAPMYADLHGLPPVLLQAGREEILLPQIQRLAECLRAAGVPLTFEIHDHLWHSGHMAANLSRSAATAVRQCGRFVAQQLDCKPADQPSEPAAANTTPPKPAPEAGCLNTPQAQSTESQPAMPAIATDIFKAYDIRGIVGHSLTEEAAYLIGRALGRRAAAHNIGEIALGRDGRLSGPALMAALASGLTDSGINVLDVGMVATPMLYFAAVQHCGGSGVMITGSHNPPDYNGFKMMLGGQTLAGDDIQALRHSIESEDFVSGSLPGSVRQSDIAAAYQDHISGHIRLARPLKIVIDAGNGVAGAFAGNLYRALGCEVTELFCEVDGRFPNHHPDPAKPENLQDLMRALREGEAEIGLAFDGDGDRLGVVTKAGHIIYPDRQLMLFAQDVLSRNPGAKIIFDVKSSRLLTPWITQYGGEVIMGKTGHSFMKAAMKQHGALLAGEMSGHVFFKERWFGFDDGLYAGARLLEILSRSPDPSAVLDALPEGVSTPEINLDVPAGGNGHAIIAELAAQARFEGEQQRITLDGLRVEFADGFGLMRASNTTPVLVLRFEADNNAALARIQAQFRTVIESHPGLHWPATV